MVDTVEEETVEGEGKERDGLAAAQGSCECIGGAQTRMELTGIELE